jgi:hypothetical protein
MAWSMAVRRPSLRILNTGFWKRLGIGFLGILPIESQL